MKITVKNKNTTTGALYIFNNLNGKGTVLFY